MSLFSSLNVAARALGVVRAQHATASHNIENASTPGYARQRAELAASRPASSLGGFFIGTGVTLSGVAQLRDRFFDAQVPASLASSSFSAAAGSTATAVTTLDPNDEFGLPASLGNFYGAVRQLSLAPADPSFRRSAVAAAERLANSVQRSAGEVASARSAADEDVSAQAAEATRAAARVAALNVQVRSARSSGGVPNDLLDARRLAAEQLAGMTGARIGEQDGDVVMQLGASVLVAGDRSASFSTRPDGANRGHLSLVVTGTDGASATLANDRVGGRIGGILHGRDDILGATEARLDDFAFEFAASLNGVHASNIALDGSSGRDLFVAGARLGAAGRLSVNGAIVADPKLLAVSSTGASGDNGGALALVATERLALASGADPTSTLSSLIGDFGSDARAALDDAEAAASASAHIIGLRDSATGVSIDEELIEIMKAQRSFEAVSKVIQTTDEMLGDLMSIIR